MRKYKRENTDHENVNRWLVSYADYMTLLFALFVVLYAMAIINEEPFETATEAIGKVFQSDKEETKNKGQGEDILPVKQSHTQKRLYGNGILDDAGPELTEGEVTLSNVSETEAGVNLSSLEGELHNALYKLIETGLAQLQIDGDWLEIELSSGLLFPSGSSSTTNAAHEVLSVIYGVISDVNNYVRVRGYTDNQPINTEVFSSNWELSVARATAVLRYLESINMNPARMAIEGYGQYYPNADNGTAQGRSQNRRVVIAISKYALRDENITTEASENGTEVGTKNALDKVDENQIKEHKLQGGGIRITTAEEVTEQ